MSKQPENPPAFPAQDYEVEYDKRWNEREEQWEPRSRIAPETHTGMSLRDYFAAKAMAALITEPSSAGDGCEWTDESVAHAAYEIADAMLEARQ